MESIKGDQNTWGRDLLQTWGFRVWGKELCLPLATWLTILWACFLTCHQGGLGDLSSTFQQLLPKLSLGWMSCVLHPPSPTATLCLTSHPHSSFYPLGSTLATWASYSLSLLRSRILQATHITSLGFSFHTNRKVMGMIIPPTFSSSSGALLHPGHLAFFLQLFLAWNSLPLFPPVPTSLTFVTLILPSLSNRSFMQDSFTEAFLKGAHRLLYSTLTLCILPS